MKTETELEELLNKRKGIPYIPVHSTPEIENYNYRYSVNKDIESRINYLYSFCVEQDEIDDGLYDIPKEENIKKIIKKLLESIYKERLIENVVKDLELI